MIKEIDKHNFQKYYKIVLLASAIFTYTVVTCLQKPLNK